MIGQRSSLIEQQNVVIDNQTFAVLRKGNDIYVSIVSLCRVLGLDSGAQKRRIKRHANLQDGLCTLPIQTTGGEQLTVCLHLEKLNAWLGGIEQAALTEEAQKRLLLYQQVFLQKTKETFTLPEPPAVPNSKQELAVLPSSQKGDLEPQIGVQLPVERQRALLANIRHTPTTRLVVSSFEEDSAFRESCLAEAEEWLHPESHYFQASNSIKVYAAHPDAPLDLAEAHEQIKKIGLSTVLAARIALGLWNSRRYDQHLSENGSTAIALHEILMWRGIKKHTKAASKTSAVRITDGYEPKYKRQVYLDFFYLQQCYLRGEYTRLDARGRKRQFIIDGPYMRVSVVRERNLWGEEEIVGFIVSPGDWITTHTGTAFGYFSALDQKIFQLHPQKDQFSLRIALYLIERWSRQAQRSQNIFDIHSYEETISTEELLSASMISFDREKFPIRFKDRIETAIQRLFEHPILGSMILLASPSCLEGRDDAHHNWREQWLSARWALFPRLEMVEEVPLLLPAPSSPAKREQQKSIPQHPKG